MIHLTTIEDKPLILDLVSKRISEIFDDFISEENKNKVIFTIQHENVDVGIMVGIALPTPTGIMATDVLWFVLPEFRGQNIGTQLLDAFEYWAKTVGSDFIAMTSLNPSMGKDYFITRGYSQQGLAYIKNIKTVQQVEQE